MSNAIYQRRYRKTRALYGDRTVDPTGTRRRIQALMTLGWSGVAIGESAGLDQKRISDIMCRRPRGVYVKTAQRIAVTYDDLCMKIPPTDTTAQRRSVGRTKALAVRRGWVSPLGWDDIDRDEAPGTGSAAELDEVVVLRLLDGEQITSTRAEKDEAMRRWLSMGNSEQSLCAKHSWRGGRYGKAS